MARKPRIIPDVHVVDMGDKGTSIARTSDGEVVIVQKDAVPGDNIDIVVRRKKKGVKLGMTLKINEPSPYRTDPFCPHFNMCGGCQWQNLLYQHQVRYKEQRVRETIKRIAKEDPEKVEHIVPCLKTSFYRNKLEYTFSERRWLTKEEIDSGEDFSNQPALGFHIPGAYDKVLDIESCFLQDSFGNEIRNYVRTIALENEWTFYNIKNHNGFLRNLILRNTSLGEWMVTLVVGYRDDQIINDVFSLLCDRFQAVNSWNYIINEKFNSSTFDLPAINISGEAYILEQLGDIKYRISPKSFFQTNSSQAKILYDLVVDFANPQKNDVVYDLYTGTGSIALYMANHCGRVVGIEEVSDAIDDAIKNAELNDIHNADFLVGDVKDVLNPDFQLRYGNPDIIITDPPRSGMHKDVVNSLLDLEAQKLVYISCNPATQARDLELLGVKYELIRVLPVDMFPHTSHIEAIALLQIK